MVLCSKCGGGLEPIARKGEPVFHFCRPCKLPHDELGRALFSNKKLNDMYTPFKSARKVISQNHPKATAVARTALEVALAQALHEAYMEGIKEGVLLAYSQDVTEGEPMEDMVKLGVSQQELKQELMDRYNKIQERLNAGLDKTAAAAEIASLNKELEAVKVALDNISE